MIYPYSFSEFQLSALSVILFYFLHVFVVNRIRKNSETAYEIETFRYHLYVVFLIQILYTKKRKDCSLIYSLSHVAFVHADAFEFLLAVLACVSIYLLVDINGS